MTTIQPEAPTHPAPVTAAGIARLADHVYITAAVLDLLNAPTEPVVPTWVILEQERKVPPLILAWRILTGITADVATDREIVDHAREYAREARRAGILP